MKETLYNNEERIDRYLHGEMTPEEETLFEEDLNKDETLQQQAETMARMAKSMEIFGSERDRMFIDQMKVSAGKKLTPVWWMSIAASLLIIFTVGYHFYDRSQTIALGQQYACVFPTETIIRGEENEGVANTLTTLFNNVANGEDIENTITQLDQLWKLSQSDTYNEYTIYAPLIGWNLAMAHLQNYDKKEAKIILDKLIENEGDEESAMKGKAIEVREKI